MWSFTDRVKQNGMLTHSHETSLFQEVRGGGVWKTGFLLRRVNWSMTRSMKIDPESLHWSLNGLCHRCYRIAGLSACGYVGYIYDACTLN